MDFRKIWASVTTEEIVYTSTFQTFWFHTWAKCPEELWKLPWVFQGFTLSSKDIKIKQSNSWAQWLMPMIPALWEAEVGGSWGQEFQTSLANMMKPISNKNTKISRVWWHAPVIPATQEAEAGELLEAEMSQDCTTALYSPGNSGRLHLKKKKKMCSFNPHNWAEVTDC